MASLSSSSAVRASAGGLPAGDSPPTADLSVSGAYQPSASETRPRDLHPPSSPGAASAADGHSGKVEVEEEQRKARGGGGQNGGSSSYNLASHGPLHSVDRAFLRVPVECGLRSLKAHSKRLHRDIAVVLAYILKGKMAMQLMDECPTVEDKMNKVDLVIEKLQKIRDKALRGSEESRAFLIRCQMRVRRLAEEPDIQEIHTKAHFSFSTYEDRTAWVVHEYLVRSGMADTAELLKHKLGLEAYTDTEVYQEVLDVLGGLLRQSTQEALDWVAEHRQKLKKLGSPFESELHVQHVLELLKKKDAKAAVSYLKSNVGPDDFGRCADIRKVVTLTALLEDPPPQYASLFGMERWHRLSCLFLHTSAQVYGFSVKPTLISLLQAGFSALKSSACEEQKAASCPACIPEWADYVRKVPTPHRVQSFLICPISGEVMDADNPPLASPDGHVYSTKAVQALAAASPDGKTVRCPKTKQAYPIERFSRIYIT